MRTILSDLANLRPLTEGLMEDFYVPGSIDWRHVFEGEVLELSAMVGDLEAETKYVVFPDGVRQIAPAGPFDAIACAQALMRVQEWMDANPSIFHQAKGPTSAKLRSMPLRHTERTTKESGGMKLPIGLTGKLPNGEYRFQFTVTNGDVKVLSVSSEGKGFDVGNLDMADRSNNPSGSFQNLPGEGS